MHDEEAVDVRRALCLDGPKSARGVRLLPLWDAYFMGYEGSSTARARQVAPEDYPRVYDKAGNATSTVIEDGMAAGVWELDADAGVVTVAPFDKLRWRDVEAQVSRAIDAPRSASNAPTRLARSATGLETRSCRRSRCGRWRGQGRSDGPHQES